MKLCRVCKRSVKPEDFVKASQTACRDCVNARRRAYMAKYRAENTDLVRSYQKKHRDKDADAFRGKTRARYRKNAMKDPREYLLKMAKKRAFDDDLPFDIDVNDVNIPECCPVLGIPIEFGFGTSEKVKRRGNGSPSLDKVVPSRGYVKGNVCVISWRANRIKSDGCEREHRLIAEYIERFKE